MNAKMYFSEILGYHAFVIKNNNKSRDYKINCYLQIDEIKSNQFYLIKGGKDTYFDKNEQNVSV